ncbi:MAG: Quercetin 2,3-dioxygenase [Syntrophaceae bacterium PtaU1.Bin231]|nr:MAG: Quercetin 2,3-dioxygenase [Syntrophaceae bacterium PtaU1.Bin231]
MKAKHVFAVLVTAAGLMMLFPSAMPAVAGPTDQLITTAEDILAANPMKAGDKLQMITVTQDGTMTFYVARLAEGAEIKPHFHKTHSETVYVFKGKGEMFIDGKWVAVGPGSVHFNPMTKIHATRNKGNGRLVLFSIFTPQMKEIDRIMVK